MELTEFSDLYAKYSRDVFRFALYLCGNRSDAEDITSETFVRAFASSERVRTETVKAYLFTIARNLFLMGLRTRSRQTALRANVPDETPTVSEHCEHKDELATVLMALQELPEVSQCVSALHFACGQLLGELLPDTAAAVGDECFRAGAFRPVGDTDILQPMRLLPHTAFAAIIVMLVPAGTVIAQGQSETSQAIEGGGVFASGWTGKIDASAEKAGQTLNNAKLTQEGAALHVTTGPATAYWNPANKGTGNYTVKATFKEPKYMNRNTHPHPYGLFIGGNDLGTAQQSYLYCAAYGNGTFIVRGFGPDAFQMNGHRPEANAAVNKAAGPGEPVSQEIAMSVKGDRVECSINGTVVAGYDKAAVVSAGKLKSTDGVYGIRFSHNTDATVTGLSLTKN